jgi:hypothetical protein
MTRLGRAIQSVRTVMCGSVDGHPDRVPPRLRRRFSLRRNAAGAWALTGALSDECIEFDDLLTALSFARADAKAGESDIELWIEGLYIFVHQNEGWPHPICSPSTMTPAG